MGQPPFGQGPSLWRVTVALAAAAVLAGCAQDRDPRLLNIREGQGAPDEFAILPTRPLETPPDLTALPPPTPGGANRVDLQPQADAVTALGGSAAALSRTGVPAADSALLASAGRYGTAADIRPVLAAEDLEFRRRNDGRLLERVFNINVYYRAYEPQSLDQYAELVRWRQAGARTPSAPPDPAEAPRR